LRINGYLHFCKVSCSHRLWQIIFSCQLSHYDYYFFNNKLQIKIYLKLWHNMSIKLQLVWIIDFYHVFFISITMKCKIQVQRNAIILSQEAYLAHFWNTFSTWLLLLEILSVCDMTIDNILKSFVYWPWTFVFLKSQNSRLSITSSNNHGLDKDHNNISP
jgi:hypothetical protein